jgi:hypothetical protein
VLVVDEAPLVVRTRFWKRNRRKHEDVRARTHGEFQCGVLGNEPLLRQTSAESGCPGPTGREDATRPTTLVELIAIRR